MPTRGARLPANRCRRAYATDTARPSGPSGRLLAYERILLARAAPAAADAVDCRCGASVVCHQEQVLRAGEMRAFTANADPWLPPPSPPLGSAAWTSGSLLRLMQRGPQAPGLRQRPDARNVMPASFFGRWPSVVVGSGHCAWHCRIIRSVIRRSSLAAAADRLARWRSGGARRRASVPFSYREGVHRLCAGRDRRRACHSHLRCDLGHDLLASNRPIGCSTPR